METGDLIILFNVTKVTNKRLKINTNTKYCEADGKEEVNVK